MRESERVRERVRGEACGVADKRGDDDGFLHTLGQSHYCILILLVPCDIYLLLVYGLL